MRTLWLLLALIGLAYLAHAAKEAIQRSRGGYNSRANAIRSSRGQSGAVGKYGKRGSVLNSRKGKRKESQASEYDDRGQVISRRRDSKGRKSYTRGNVNYNRKHKKTKYCKKKLRSARKWKKLSSKRKEQCIRLINSFGSKTSGGKRGGLAARKTKDGDDEIVGKAGGGGSRLESGRTRKTKCNKKGKKCKKLYFKDRKGAHTMDRDLKKSKKGRQEGRIYSNRPGKRQKKYYFRVVCKESRKKKGQCKGGSPAKIVDERGKEWDCQSKESGDTTETTCCKNGRGCVKTYTDADGKVSFRKGRVRSGKANCNEKKKPKVVGRNEDAGTLTIKKYDCGLDSTGKLNSNIQNIKAKRGSASCKSFKKGRKRLKILKPKYKSDKDTKGGFVTYDFPHCGKMSATLKFIGFSKKELRDIIPRLAYQYTVNTRPVGSFKCRDDGTCLAMKTAGKGLQGTNCYYCKWCDKDTRKEGILADADVAKTCDKKQSSSKQKISAQICPISDGAENDLCPAFAKTAQDSTGYWEEKQDLVIKIAVYLRAKPGETASKKNWRKQRKSAFWRLAKTAHQGRDRLEGDEFFSSTKGMTKKQKKLRSEYQAYKGFMRQQGKGALLTCQTFTGDYNLAGDDMTEFMDAYTTMLNSKGLMSGAKECEGVQRKWAEKNEDVLGGGSSSSSSSSSGSAVQLEGDDEEAEEAALRVPGLQGIPPPPPPDQPSSSSGSFGKLFGGGGSLFGG